MHQSKLSIINVLRSLWTELVGQSLGNGRTAHSQYDLHNLHKHVYVLCTCLCLYRYFFQGGLVSIHRNCHKLISVHLSIPMKYEYIQGTFLPKVYLIFVHWFVFICGPGKRTLTQVVWVIPWTTDVTVCVHTNCNYWQAAAWKRTLGYIWKMMAGVRFLIHFIIHQWFIENVARQPTISIRMHGALAVHT